MAPNWKCVLWGMAGMVWLFAMRSCADNVVDTSIKWHDEDLLKARCEKVKS